MARISKHSARCGMNTRTWRMSGTLEVIMLDLVPQSFKSFVNALTKELETCGMRFLALHQSTKHPRTSITRSTSSFGAVERTTQEIKLQNTWKMLSVCESAETLTFLLMVLA